MRISLKWLSLAALWLAVSHGRAHAHEPIPSQGLYCSRFYWLGGVCDPGAPDLPTPAGYAAVWAEFMTLEQVREALPQVAPTGLAINLEWPADDLDNPERFALVREAAALGIEIRPWLLLPAEEGYWPNSTNTDLFASATHELMALWEREGLSPSRLLVDLEMPLERSLEYAEVTRSGSLGDAVTFLRSGIDRPQFAAATRTFAALVDHAHQLGWEVEAVTIPQALDDYADGDDDLKQAFNTPLDGIDWDAVSFIAYRTLAEDAVGVRPTPYFVYTYGVHARQVFGERAGIAIGLTNPGEITPDAPYYTDGDDIRGDVEAARSAGIHGSNTSVYNLRGLLEQPPLEQWLQRPRWQWRPPRTDLTSDFVRGASLSIDWLL